MSSFQKPTKQSSMNNLENPTRSARSTANDQQMNFTSKDSDINNRMLPGFFPPLGVPGSFPVPPFFPLNMFGSQSNLFDANQQQQQQSNPNKQNQNNNGSSANAIDLETPNPGLLQMILQNNHLAQQQATPNILLQHALLQKQQQQQQLQQQQKQQSAGPVPPESLQLLLQLQQQQQIQQQQQSQQQLLQQQTAAPSFSSSQLIQHLSRLNNPILLQQLYNTVTNPYENARFSNILLRLQQNAAANALANGNSIIPSSNGIPSQQTAISQQVSTIQNTASQNIQQKLIQQQKQKEELTNMLEYLVERMHQVETDQIFEKKREFKYIVGEDLSIFDNIVHKYQFSKKTKEEMIKYILRKCFKFLKSNIKQQEIVGQKDIEVAFTRKYFGGELESQQQLQIQRQFMTSENQVMSKDSDDSDDEKPQLSKSIISYQVKEENIDQQQSQDESIPRNNLQLPSAKNLPPASTNNLEQEDIIEKVMPFKQGSKIKTMNIQFLKMIFHSEVFAKDYQLYLEKFEELAQKENQKKVQKCVKNLQDFIEKGQINKVKSYKRLPWLRIWLKETFELAKTLCVYAEDEPVKEAEISNSQTELKKKQRLNISSCSKVNNGEESGLNDQQAASQSDLNNKQPSEEQILEATLENAEWKTPQQVRRSPQRSSQTDVQRSPQRSSQTDTASEKDTARFDIPNSKKSSDLIQSVTSLQRLGEIQERIKREDVEQGNMSPGKITYPKQE